MGKKKRDEEFLCDNPDHPEFNGQPCLCHNCNRLDYYCTSAPCLGCDGPVTECDYGGDEDSSGGG